MGRMNHWSTTTTYSTLTKKLVVHAGGHTPGPPIDSGAQLSEGHQLADLIDGDVTPKCTKTGVAEETDNQPDFGLPV